MLSTYYAIYLQKKEQLLKWYQAAIDKMLLWPAPIRRIAGFLLFIIGVVSIVNPFVPGRLFILASSQLVIYNKRKTIRAFANIQGQKIASKIKKIVHVSRSFSSRRLIKQSYFKKRLCSLLVINDR